MPAIETTGLTKVYKPWFGKNRIVALEDLNLKVRRNNVFGFLGPNGAGKTTTIQLLLGLIEPTVGDARVLGAPIGDANAKERIGFLPDTPSFYSHLTAYDFMVYCSRLLHVPWDEYPKRIAAILELVGLADVKYRKLEEFSRGMLQRVGIGQALLNQPDLVILDEPLNGLDPLGRVEFKRIIKEIKSQGKTVFFSSHILADVQEVCDEVGILNRGRLVVAGTVDELIGDGSVTVWVDKLSGTALDQAENMSTTAFRKQGRWGFELKSEVSEEKFREFVESSGGHVTGSEKKRLNLEDFFLNLIEEDNQKRNKQKEQK